MEREREREREGEGELTVGSRTCAHSRSIAIYEGDSSTLIPKSSKSENLITKKMSLENQRAEEAPLYGELLETILSHVPLIHLISASHVSKTWRHAVSSSLSIPSRVKPWLILHIQNRRIPSITITRAYDPSSHVWIEIMGVETRLTSPLRSSHSNLLYMLTPSNKLAFSFDKLNDTWHNVVGPSVWRNDPIVAIVGSYLIIAGGTCDFEDDPLAVEMYDMRSNRWDTCQSMPDILKDSAATTWLSVAVSDQKLYLIEKNSGKFCSFDPETKIWEARSDLRPISSIFFSVIGFLRDRLILVGLTGNDESVETLRIWEVNCETLDCKERGKMPSEMLESLASQNSPLSSIGISTAEDFVYIYNPSYTKEIFHCELLSGGICQWGKVQNWITDDGILMDRIVFSCSKVGIDDLENVLMRGKRKFTVN